jgi:hypothetical protein
VEAMKSYKMALRHDPTNVQLLRDLGILQMHVRKQHCCVHDFRKLSQLICFVSQLCGFGFM